MREKGDHVTIISLPQRLDLFGLTPGMDLAPRAEEEASMSSTPQTHVTHNSYTVEFKLQVLDWYHNNGKNKNAAAKQFGVDRKRIRDWEMNEQLLREQTAKNVVAHESAITSYNCMHTSTCSVTL